MGYVSQRATVEAGLEDVMLDICERVKGPFNSVGTVVIVCPSSQATVGEGSGNPPRAEGLVHALTGCPQGWVSDELARRTLTNSAVCYW